MTVRMTQAEEKELADALEERADHIADAELLEGTATGDFFDRVHSALIARGTKLIVGPRGCGKTHLMRYTALRCRNEQELPLALYVTFNRYYRLEPLLKSKANAIELFHVWVLARIVQALDELLKDAQGISVDQRLAIVGVESSDLNGMIARLERGLSLTTEDLAAARKISLPALHVSIEGGCRFLGRQRAVVLLDDAALTLTPEYLYEFFDIVRALKSQRVSPKASVYPGTTEYGPRFHATHEAETIAVWLSVDDPNYTATMQAIAERRFPELATVPKDLSDLLKYAAFGVPRAYLVMLREFCRGEFATTQQAMNKIIEGHIASRLAEYESLRIKMPKFSSLVSVGQTLFRSIVDELKAANLSDVAAVEKQIVIGIQDQAGEPPLLARMISLLLEAGLLYEHPRVSHGPERVYRRYTPHISALINARAFSAGTRGTSPRMIVEVLQKKQAKHPLRRMLNNLLDVQQLSAVKLDLPACDRCGTPRINESQKFCHQCGSELLDGSTYARCMELPLTDVPGLTDWQKEKLADLTQVRTIGDLLALQDPGTELRKIRWVGNVRAGRILQLVTVFVDEFLS